MTIYECRCGFTSGTAVGFQRHIARFKGEAGEVGKHRMVGRPNVTASQSKTASAPSDEPAVVTSAPSDRSWLGSLWTSGGQQGPATGQNPAEPLPAVKNTDKSLDTGDPQPQQAGTADTSSLTKAASSSGGDSSWEKLSSLAADSGEETASPKDEYAAITAQLAAAGPSAGTRARAKRPAATDAKARLASCQPRRSSRDPPSAALSASRTASGSLPAVPHPTDAAAEPASSTHIQTDHTAASPTQPSPDPPQIFPSQASQLISTSPAESSSQTGTQQPAAAAAAAVRAARSGEDEGVRLQGSDRLQPSPSATALPQSTAAGSPHSLAAGRQDRAGSPASPTSSAAEPGPSTAAGQKGDMGRGSGRPPLAEPEASHSPPAVAAADAFVHAQGSRLLKKSMEVANWLKASTDAALSLEPSSRQGGAGVQQHWQCSPEDVEAVLVWQDRRCSSKVFLSGLYALICCRQLALGVEVLQPSSGIAGGLLAVLLLNVGRVTLLTSRGRSSNPEQRERALQARITQWALLCFSRLAPLLGACAAMLYRRLSGHDRMGTTVWLGLSLWAVMGIGEAGLMQQSSLAIALWCCLFGLPSLYLQCRHILDALVEESLHLVALSLRTGQRGTFGLAGGAGLIILATAPLGTFARVSLALLSAWSVLFWKACLMSSRGRLHQKVHRK